MSFGSFFSKVYRRTSAREEAKETRTPASHLFTICARATTVMVTVLPALGYSKMRVQI